MQNSKFCFDNDISNEPTWLRGHVAKIFPAFIVEVIPSRIHVGLDIERLRRRRRLVGGFIIVPKVIPTLIIVIPSIISIVFFRWRRDRRLPRRSRGSRGGLGNIRLDFRISR